MALDTCNLREVDISATNPEYTERQTFRMNSPGKERGGCGKPGYSASRISYFLKDGIIRGYGPFECAKHTVVKFEGCEI